MSYSKKEILKELSYIDSNYEFSLTCPFELQEELFSNGLIEDIEGSILITYEAEVLLGKDKEDLKDIYNDNNYYSFYQGEVIDDE